MTEQAIDWGSVKVGDLNLEPEGNGDCPAIGHPLRFRCTREAGHSGQHVASGRTHVKAVWTDGEAS